MVRDTHHAAAGPVARLPSRAARLEVQLRGAHGRHPPSEERFTFKYICACVNTYFSTFIRSCSFRNHASENHLAERFRANLHSSPLRCVCLSAVDDREAEARGRDPRLSVVDVDVGLSPAGGRSVGDGLQTDRQNSGKFQEKCMMVATALVTPVGCARTFTRVPPSEPSLVFLALCLSVGSRRA